MSLTLPKDTIANNIVFGDYVRSTNHGHTGRVYQFETLTAEDQSWVNYQNIKLSQAQQQEPMICILVHNSGAVSVPANTCVRILPIADFNHPYNDEYFSDI